MSGLFKITSFIFAFGNLSIDRLRDSRVHAKVQSNLEVTPKNVTFGNLLAISMNERICRSGDLSRSRVGLMSDSQTH